MQLQWQNHPCTGKIKNELPNTQQTQVENGVKYINVTNISQIQLPFPMEQPPQYMQLIPNIIAESLMK